MPDPAADRNLLFGILALQMDFISRDALIAAMHAWVLDKVKPLGQILRAQGALRDDAHALLEALVQKHLELHGNDPEKSLAALSSVGSVRRNLLQVADADVQASLAHVSAARKDNDPFATRGTTASVPTGSGLRYSILRPHAKGGLGEVFVARDEELRREVALKEIQDHCADHPESRARFLLEAEVTGGLEHPGIVPVYGLGHYGDGRPFYAMRFIRGDSLKQAIDRFHKEKKNLPDGERTLRLRQLLGRFVDVCQAVAYAHSRGVLHRDLKPGNVMLGKYGETLVVDWGLAKPLGRADSDSAEGPLQPSLSGDSGMTQAGSALGTPAYMSPEQAAGRRDQLGPPSDVYSLGATLYHLLAGQSPLANGQVGEILDKVQRGDYPRPRALDPRIPPALEAVCRKAMALKPGDRYGSPQALADDLEKWLADEPVTAYPEPLPARAARWARRHRTLVTASLLVLVTLIGAAVAGALVVGREQERARALAAADALEGAGADAVPALLQALARHRADVQPRLRARWQDPALPDGRRLRLGLALAGDGEVRERLVALARKAENPRGVLLARAALAPHAAQVVPGLWEHVAEPSTPASERFRLLVLLAALAPDDGRWADFAPEQADALVRENPLRVPDWADALRPAAGWLLPALSAIFRDADRAEAERGLATRLLADYAADRPEVLADVTMDADAKQFAVLFPPLQQHPDQAVAALRAELGRRVEPPWFDPPLNPSWRKPGPELIAKVEAGQGLLTERFAFCQALPLADFRALTEGLRPCGYRPVRFRPYADGAGLLVAAVWSRDGRAWAETHGTKAEAVPRLEQEWRCKGYVPADVASYATPDGWRYALLWERAEPGEEAHVYAGLPPPVTLRMEESWASRGLMPSAWAIETLRGRPSAVWRKDYLSLSFNKTGPGPAQFLAALPQSSVLADVTVTPLADPVHLELLAWLSGPPWWGLALRRTGPAPIEVGYAGILHRRQDREDKRLIGLDPTTHLAQCRQLAAQDYRPASLAVAGRLVASVWHRPLVGDAGKERLAKRQANAAVALLRLGEDGPVWPLLKHSPDPRVRSYLIHRLAPLGADPGVLMRWLTVEPDVSVKRALLLCLGEFTPEQLPQAQREGLLGTLLGWYRDDPDPGLHGAAEWLLQQWQMGDMLRLYNEWLAGRAVEPWRRWYMNRQGQTFVIVPGPVEFVMGSPRTEAGRPLGDASAGEMQHRERIDRTFALAAKMVTTRQFWLSRKDHPGPGPGGSDPPAQVNWYEAAAYCNWLSQAEGIPEDQRCYLPNAKGEYAEGMRVKPGHLALTGYRLPTEAEWEYACRAGAVTSRYYGETEELLGEYAWYTKVRRVRRSGDSPVGWLEHSRTLEYVDRPVARLSPGLLKPNDLGLFDMLGNGEEWCGALYSDFPAAYRGGRTEGEGLPQGAWAGQPVGVVRGGEGGSHLNLGPRSAGRRCGPAASRSPGTGFRPARTLR